MLFLFNYKRQELPYRVIIIHEFLVKDIFSYFENSSFVRKKIKSAQKTLKDAILFAKKKKVYPSIKTGLTLDILQDMMNEIEYTHQVIKATSAEMEKLILKIKQEMIGDILPILETARNEFREDRFQVGLDLLQKTQQRLKNKYLTKTRKEILGGINNEVREIKNIIREKKIHPQDI